MKIALIAQVIVASRALAAPLTHAKNHYSEVQKHEFEDLPPITTFVTPGGFIQPAPQFPQASKSARGINDSNAYNDERRQRIIDNVQAAFKKSGLNVSKDAIRTVCRGRDGKYYAEETCGMDHEYKQISPLDLFPPALYPNSKNEHLWNETSFWNETAKLWEKRATNQEGPGSENTQKQYPATKGYKSSDAKFAEGRQALKQVRAYLDDENKLYPDGDDLPQVFNHAWKVIVHNHLPINFRRTYMKMVEEYLRSALARPRSPQDVSGRIPVDLEARDLEHQQQDPPRLKNFIPPERFEDWFRHRDDDGGFELPEKDEERSFVGRLADEWSNSQERRLHARDEDTKKDDESWFNGTFSLDSDDDSKDAVKKGEGESFFDELFWDSDAKDEEGTLEVYWSTQRKRSLPNETSPSQVFDKDPAEELSPEEEQRVQQLFDSFNESLSVLLNLGNHTHVSFNDTEETALYGPAVVSILSLLLELESAGNQKNFTHFEWKRSVPTEDEEKLKKLTEAIKEAIMGWEGWNAISQSIKYEFESEIKKITEKFNSTGPSSPAKRFITLDIDGEAAYERFHAKDYKPTKQNFKRQMTPEKHFSKKEQVEAFSRAIKELVELKDPNNAYQNKALTKKEQEKFRDMLRKKIENGQSASDMPVASH